MDTPIDYERPISSKRWDRSATEMLFREACQLGDKHACIVEAQLADVDRDRASYDAVKTNCLVGDVLSCRALPPDRDVPRFPDVRGAMSRRIECQNGRLASPCDARALRDECAAEFPAACSELALSSPTPADADELFARSAQLSIRGCQGGIASECRNVATYPRADQRDMTQRLCDIRPAECDLLGFELVVRGDLAGARDSLERACQYGGDEHPATCAQLAKLYLGGKLEEPVPGRAQALLNYACPKLAVLLKENLLTIQPVCKHASVAK